MNLLLSYGFMVATLIALGLSLVYSGWRLRPVFGFSRAWPISLAMGLMLVVAVASVLLMPRSANLAVGRLYVASGYGFYLYLNLFLTLIIAHAAQRLAKVPSRWAASIAVVVAIGMTVAGAVQADRFDIVKTDVPIASLRRDLDVMHVSDLHLGHHRGRDYLARVVAATNAADPDFVVFTGDVMDSDAALRPDVLAPLAALKAPSFYVMGNHEETIDTGRALRLLATTGVRILHNEVVVTHGLQLVGLDYMNADEQALNMHPSAKRETIRSVLRGLKLRPDLPTIILHHSPTGLHYAQERGADLFLAGHTHGGQFFPFTWLMSAISPFNAGLNKMGRMQVFVSPGAGTFMMRARLWKPNELDLLHLEPSTDHSREHTSRGALNTLGNR